MKPIRSRPDLERARASLLELRDQIARLKRVYGHDPNAFDLATRGLRQLAHETEEAIRIFEETQAGQIPSRVAARNPRTGILEIPQVLRRLRRAAGLDQTELALRLDTRQSDISRWEREGYDRYQLITLQRIADALGYDLEVVFLRRDSAGKEPS